MLPCFFVPERSMSEMFDVCFHNRRSEEEKEYGINLFLVGFLYFEKSLVLRRFYFKQLFQCMLCLNVVHTATRYLAKHHLFLEERNFLMQISENAPNAEVRKV